jgi:23S rRNA (guanosine2251-2'-O)-methyltransferase
VHGDAIDEIKTLAAQELVPINKVPIEKLNGFNISNHEGCIAQIAKIQYQDLQQIISFVVENGETPLFIILDGVTDIRNIGAIARSAFSFGVHAIIIPEQGN